MNQSILFYIRVSHDPSLIRRRLNEIAADHTKHRVISGNFLSPLDELRDIYLIRGNLETSSHKV